MRITFVQVWHKEDIFSYYSPAIATLSAVLKERGHEVSLHVTHWEETDEAFLNSVLNTRPRVVGFSILSNNWWRCRHLIKLLKKYSDVTVIAGGYHPTFAPEEVFAQSPVDALCIGEGEVALVEYLDALSARKTKTDVRNFWFRDPEDSSKIIRNPVRPPVGNLDSIPDPDRELFVQNASNPSFSSHLWHTQLQAGRGCHFRCTFCANSGMLDLYGGARKFIRLRSPRRVLAEVEKLIRVHPGRELFFSDEVFPLRRSWLTEFLVGMEKLGRPAFNVLLRCEFVRPELLARLKEAGCTSVSMGVECGNFQYRRDMLGRNMSNDTIRRAFDAVRNCGLKAGGFFMIGLPYETNAHLDETIKLYEELRPDVWAVQVYCPLPGSRLYELCKREGLLRPAAENCRAPNMLEYIRHVHLDPKKLAETCQRFGIPVESTSGRPPKTERKMETGGYPASPDQNYLAFVQRFVKRFPLQQIEELLSADWKAARYSNEPPYLVLELEHGKKVLRIGVAPRGSTNAFYAATSSYEIAYLTAGDGDISRAEKRVLHRILEHIKAIDR